ncbi:MAG TPA: lipoprotein-releasing ABC transporter permease subunit [Syntrophales bacterium]|nr:lipoprotein-releasing ABC transporter permease subunit [Syntrophales bacterium]
MAYEFFIGLRYLRAKRKQAFISVNTFISVAGVFLGVAALIIVLSVMNGFEIELRDKILGINSHIVLMEYSGGMENPERVMEELKTIDGIVASTPFIYGQAMMKNEGRAVGAILRGMSTETSADVINLGKIIEGDIGYLSGRGNDAGLPGVVIGKELAQNLGLVLFDTVEIVLPMGISTPMGVVPKIKKFSVVGIFESGSYEYDSSLAFVSLEDCKQFLDMHDEVTGIEIKVTDIFSANKIAKAIEEKLGYPYWARSWMVMNKNLFSALKLERRVMFIILSLVVLVAAFNIITTLIMTVMEKAKDIAILKSMGATGRGIMKIFMIEGIVIGAIGTVLGCITGITVALNLAWLSRSIEDLFHFKILPKGVYYLNDIPSQINCQDVIVIVIAALLLSFLAAIYPSWRASKLDPAEALRYE